MKRIRTVIVDDEPLARSWLRGLLEEDAGVELAGEATNGVEAIECVMSVEPELLFLDVEMPELDGFGVVEALGEQRPACIVFVTAYDRFAIQAFEVHALDYLLKPFDRERLEKTMARVRAQLAAKPQEELPAKIHALLETLQLARKQERIAVKDSGKVFFVRVEDIDWIEACGNYVKLHLGSASHLLLQTMNGMEGRLDADRFLRVHRSTIVNIDRIEAVEPLFHGEYSVKLKSGDVLTLSRGYRERLQALIERFSS